MRVPRFARPAVVAFTVAAGWVAAVQAGPIASGTFEFSPSASFNRSTFTPAGGGDAASITHLNVGAAVGRAFNERFEVAGGVIFQHRAESGTGRNAVGGSLGGIWNFPGQDNLVPFLSANVGFIQFSNQGESDRAMLLPMLRLGLRSIIGDSRSLNVSVGFQHEVNPKSAIEDAANVFDIGVGMSLFKSHS